MSYVTEELLSLPVATGPEQRSSAIIAEGGNHPSECATDIDIGVGVVLIENAWRFEHGWG
ncbi:hypothetical protein [Streptomyces sp. NBC_00588]|uniref:hypothetical protein n=1 Tax=Streptomyces sp. NBC_00588 TaxID=2975784 RepID=UPI002E81B454|nr:hypothetical protein [Streptomyces sp. NBC_00588]WUB40131.1 hypothetical protein OHN38_36395 [Streptomyces sp. NBC_00588]